MKICEEPRFVEIFVMIRGFYSKVDWKLSNGSKVTSFST